MKAFTSFIRRISRGGVLAAGVAALLSTGCELAYDEYDEEYDDVGQAGDLDVAYTGHDKVTICHFPGHSLERYNTISVSESALQQHLDHGDLVGDCDDVVCDDFFCAGS